MKDRSGDGSSPPVWKSPALVLLLGCAAAGIGAVAVSQGWFRNRAAPAQMSATADTALPAWPPATSLPWPDAPYENTDPGVEYVGSTACRECHPAEFESYGATSHGRAFRAVSADDEPPDGSFLHGASRRRYEVSRDESGLRHREVLLLPGGSERPSYDLGMDYALGSGQFGHAYLANVDGFLIQSPVTWYAGRASWGLSPGYDGARHMSFRRYLSDECLFCHTGKTSRHEGNPTRLAFHEMSIGCERCHGPGARHVARRRSGSAGGSDVDLSIVNPARLTGKSQEAVCAQCHLRGEADALVRGRRMDDFRPGLPLDQFRVDYRREEADDEMSVVGHYAQLRRSRCYTASHAITCLTCHNPHSEVGPRERRDHYRAICLSCHTPDGCGLPQPERTLRAADDCTDCHMPDAATEVPHVAFTHHRIGIHSPAATDPQPRTRDLAAGELMPIDAPDLPAVEQARLLGLAHYTQFKASEGRGDEEHHRREAHRLLNEALRGGAGDPPVRAALAELAWRERDASTAMTLAESVVADGADGTRAWVDAASLLAEAAFARGEFTRARELYAQLTTLRHDARYWFFLGLCEQNCGRTDAAIQALEKSLEIDPVQTGAHQMLAALHQGAGRPSSAIEHQRTAGAIERFLRQLESPVRGKAGPPGPDTETGLSPP